MLLLASGDPAGSPSSKSLVRSVERSDSNSENLGSNPSSPAIPTPLGEMVETSAFARCRIRVGGQFND